MAFPHDDDMTPKRRKQLIKIANPRIMEIRFMVNQERYRLAELERRLGDDLTAMLKRPSRLLDDVEGFYLDNKTLFEPRSDAELNRWLDNAQRLLKLAIKDREQVEELGKKYGPNARWIGD